MSNRTHEADRRNQDLFVSKDCAMALASAATPLNHSPHNATDKELVALQAYSSFVKAALGQFALSTCDLP